MHHCQIWSILSTVSYGFFNELNADNLGKKLVLGSAGLRRVWPNGSFWLLLIFMDAPLPFNWFGGIDFFQISEGSSSAFTLPFKASINPIKHGFSCCRFSTRMGWKSEVYRVAEACWHWAIHSLLSEINVTASWKMSWNTSMGWRG